VQHRVLLRVFVGFAINNRIVNIHLLRDRERNIHDHRHCDRVSIQQHVLLVDVDCDELSIVIAHGARERVWDELSDKLTHWAGYCYSVGFCDNVGRADDNNVRVILCDSVIHGDDDSHSGRT
jgi:hypothetical protein